MFIALLTIACSEPAPAPPPAPPPPLVEEAPPPEPPPPPPRLLRKRAARLSEEEMRRSFLENVAEKREIVELAAALDRPGVKSRG